MPARPNDLYSITNLSQIFSFDVSRNVCPFIGPINRPGDMLSPLDQKVKNKNVFTVDVCYKPLALAFPRLLWNIWALAGNNAVSHDAESVLLL